MSLIPFPTWEDEIAADPGKQPAKAHSPPITVPETTHSKAIQEYNRLNSLKGSSSNTGEKESGKLSVSPTPSDQFQALLDGMHSLQQSMAQQGQQLSQQGQQISKLEAKAPNPYAQAFQPIARQTQQAGPSSVPTGGLITADPQAPQEYLNMELVKVIQSLTEKKKTKESHIAKCWEETILPKITAERLIKTHDYSQNTYGQRAAVASAKTLLMLYELSWNPDNAGAANPNAIPTDSPYHALAVEQSKAIQDSLMAGAFPKNDKPLQKERKQLLAAVMGSDISAKDLTEAYEQDNYRGNNYRGRGRGGKNWRGRGRGRGDRGRGRGKGRGRDTEESEQ